MKIVAPFSGLILSLLSNQDKTDFHLRLLRSVSSAGITFIVTGLFLESVGRNSQFTCQRKMETLSRDAMERKH